MLFEQIKNLLKTMNNRSLSMIIFFVTSRCNARCAHCFNWKNINKRNEDLTLKEIKELTLSMPRLKMILFSGGEPFLRDDLFEIVSLFYSNLGVKVFHFPTNGSLPRQIHNTVKQILEKLPEANVSVNFSLDCLGVDHDTNRGLPGSFAKLRQSINCLRPLRDKYKTRLAIKTNTVIMPGTDRKLIDLISFLEKEYGDLDDHLFELLRGDPKDFNLKRKIAKKELFGIYRLVREHRARMLLSKIPSKKEVIFRLANLILMQKIQSNAYFGKSWGFPCLAGQTIGVIDHNGDLRHCELRRPIANLRKYHLNFYKAWNSRNSKKELKMTAQIKCWQNCTHICFIADSAYRHIGIFLFKTPWSLAVSVFTVLKIKGEKSVWVR